MHLASWVSLSHVVDDQFFSLSEVGQIVLTTGVSLRLVYANGQAGQVLKCHRTGYRGHRGSLSFWLRLCAFLSTGQVAWH